MRDGKRYVSNNLTKRSAKSDRPKKSVKLSSQDWYKRTAAAISINRVHVPPPAIARE